MSLRRWILLPPAAVVLVLAFGLHRPTSTTASGWDPPRDRMALATATPAASAVVRAPIAACAGGDALAGPASGSRTALRGAGATTAPDPEIAALTAALAVRGLAPISAAMAADRGASVGTLAGATSPAEATGDTGRSKDPLPATADGGTSGGLPLNGGFTAGGVWVRAPLGHMPSVPRPSSGNG